MNALAYAHGLLAYPMEGAIATSLRGLNDSDAVSVGRRFLSALLSETGAQAAGLALMLDHQGAEILHAPNADPVRRAGLSSTLQGGRLSSLGGYCKRWPLRDGGALLLQWDQAPSTELLGRLQQGLQQLELFCRQLQQLAAVESARLAWQCAIRHQAMLSETLAWLAALPPDLDLNTLYNGLLQRARIICNARGGALALYRLDGARFQWLDHSLPEAQVQQALDSRPYPPEPATLWQARLGEGHVSFFELAVVTPKGLRARLFLADKHEGDIRLNFTPQDMAYINQLAAQVFRTLEKVELMEDLKISNQFLAMERQDLNRLVSELKNTQQQLLHSEKLASIGQLAAGVAHEINNPVSFVSSNLFHLQQHVRQMEAMLDHYQLLCRRQGETPLLTESAWHRNKQDLSELLAESREGLDRVRHIVLDLRNFSRVGESGWQMSNLNDCLESTLNIVRNEIKYKAELSKHYDLNLPPIQCLPSQINQVILNLLINAAQAINERGTIGLESGRQGDEVFFSVRDSGQGISPEYLDKIFDPFFTTKPVGKGTGLGLSLAYGIVQRHSGRIEVESSQGRGSCFTVWLPIQQPDTGAHEPA